MYRLFEDAGGVRAVMKQLEPLLDTGALTALDGAGLTGQVAVVTDGQLSGLVNNGIVVGEISPEAARGGPLALVRDGDLGSRSATVDGGVALYDATKTK